MAVNLLQWNTKSIRHKKSEITYLIKKYNPVIFAIAETWLRPDHSFRMAGYACFRDDRSDGYAGCALLVDTSVVYSHLPIPQHDPGIHVVSIRALNITFVSVYIPHPSIALISELNNILSNLSPPLIVLGDFNCKHTMWGSHTCDVPSTALLSLLDDINICVLNDGSPTRRVSPFQNVSAVDLTLASPNIMTSASWKVLPLSFGSDHFPILTAIPKQNSPPTPVPPILKYKTAEADWNLYSNILEEKIRLLPATNSSIVSEIYSSFVDCLLSAADESIPLKNVASNKRSSPPWWDSDCTRCVRDRNQQENTFSANPTLANYLKFKKSSAYCKRVLAKKKGKDGINSASPYLLALLLP